jgi:hypothetical protein
MPIPAATYRKAIRRLDLGRAGACAYDAAWKESLPGRAAGMGGQHQPRLTDSRADRHTASPCR